MSLEVALKHRLGDFVLDLAFVTKGRVTALFGPSGAGKSRVIAAIAGLMRPRQGRIAVGGRVLTETPKTFVPPEARRLAVVFQDARLFPHMEVEDNLLFGWRRAPVKADAARIAHVIGILDLGGLLRRRPHDLSGGEKARVALGRALLASPEMLLLDEPLASLDAARRSEILPYLERLARETDLPMLYVSHQVDEVARLADEIVVIEKGRVTAQGPVFDLLADVEAPVGVPPLGAVLDATVAEHQADGLTRLAFDGGVLLVPSLARPAGTKVRVRLRAEDLMLALEEPRAISANNVLPCSIAAIKPVGDHVDVQLRCGGTRLVSRITGASATRLQLASGQQVYAVVKAVTVAREG
ncbi:molybdenum ABC transporter ATP-binding protein [Rhizomicrobium electricum]|uniref:Molybdenum ABC transporter ATP-binding protein n=1 Tax=Rhizomicrobium electricum TaxID=480070 RepID=A0ABN1EYJ4_9PROT|nr:molybdenum ABC transporter ATP-binding protein [Rhizomicrobium electricum]NIJ49824.1 molybdate transport system ATP-binding protein [Rhizomicrobium electricum]